MSLLYGTVTGIRLSGTNKDLIGATVTLTANGGDYTQTTQTVDEGTYELKDIPIGIYNVTASQTGFYSSTQSDFLISSNTEPTQLDFLLAQDV
jgi:Carboxypeptidase regulatory-like domain